ncbi:peptidoglycan L-alanyl-D-glutamate endopeptidase CwlK [Aneurinibacillus soli]|uniref:Peptidoglycan L-alanyl-D-glutamate endopeptidase CwlK n=1 Tax=Aneurinibacillus soli TaxID=1500254 RepID=A0A0U5BL79_9BACL|nr:M15 family metallopeptidase [Aneurinibacillus soli]PYE62999.1 peptidoglycan L-alanyl-D-glutamate endopeptidase CwlK [Aneurinibacillus soli]BAU28942.1 Peptidoglycan L-alanyl-D-glutamate endopeptidase CwlK precursor [Aneurinibacillus soli]
MIITWEWLVKKNSRLNDTNVHPTVRQKAWDAIFELWNKGIYVLITQGYRSIAEQNDLYAQGRTKLGKIVTNAKGGQSYHNFGLALDFALYIKGGADISWDEKADFNGDRAADWLQVVQAFKARGFAWGGDFRSFKDTPHVEMIFGLNYRQLSSGSKPPQGPSIVTIPTECKQTTSKTNSLPNCFVVVNGAKLLATGIMCDNLSYLPVRAVGNATGVPVGFENGKALLGKGALQTTLVVGDTGYAHAREIADVLGYKVDWDGKTQTVSLTKGAR